MVFILANRGGRMFLLSKVVGVISCSLLTFLVALNRLPVHYWEDASQTMSDASISTAVQAKLTSDHLSNFPRIDVDTERGVVNLSGVVETEAQRAQASRLAKQVEGVVRVNNNLQIQDRPPSGKQSTPAQANERKASQPEKTSGLADSDK